MGGEVDVDGICDWTLQAGDEGMDALNARLKKKYGSDMDEFLLALAIEPFDEMDDDDDDDGGGDNEIPGPPSEPFPGEAPAAPEAAVLSRPTIPSERRRRPTIEPVKVGDDGQVVAPPPDHAAPLNLSQQLTEFLKTQADSTDKGVDLQRYLKLAADHGLVALNSELLARFGCDLKGEVVEQQTTGPHDATRFGVGMDNKILAEMQTAALRHDTGSGRSLEASDEAGSHACSKFRLDTKATTFGICKCGFDRNAHLLQMSRQSTGMSNSLRRKLEKRASSAVPATVIPKPSPTLVTAKSAPPAPSQQPSSGPAAPKPASPVKEAPRPVVVASLDPPNASNRPSRTPSMESTSSATKKLAPSPKPLQPKELKPKRPVSRKAVGGLERVAGRGPTPKANQACPLSDFRLDMGADQFGVCAKCGWKKTDHVAVAPAASATPVLPAAEPPRPMSIRKDGPAEPCNSYKLDINADTFGACTCGFARCACSRSLDETTDGRARSHVQASAQRPSGCERQGEQDAREAVAASKVVNLSHHT